MTPSCNLEFGLKGRYKLTAHKADKDGNIISTRELTPWFDNLITNYALDFIATQGGDSTADRIAGCVVGSGNTTPAFTDTGLSSYVAASSTLAAGWVNTIQNSATPYYSAFTVTHRFGTGVAAGNLSEVGMFVGGSGALNVRPLYSRALILDTNGNPTTITVLSDEILDVTYELRVYLPNGGNDVTGNFNQTIDGVVTNFAYTIRAISFYQGGVGGWGLGSVFYSTQSIGNFFGGSGYPNGGGVDNAALQALSASPNFNGGLGFSTTQQPAPTYTSGNYYVDGVANIGLTAAYTFSRYNLCISRMCSYQMKITPAIVKDATKIYTITVRVSWGRY